MKNARVKLDNAFMQRVAQHVGDLMLESFDKEKAAVERFEPSDSFKAKTAEIIMENQKRRHRTRTVKTVLLAAAVVMILIIGAIGVTAERNGKMMFVIPEERGEFLNVCYDISNTDTEDIPKEIKEFRYPSYVPEGFEESFSFKCRASNDYDWMCGDKIIMYSQYLIGTNLDVNISDSDLLPISINGNMGICAHNDDEKKIVWSDTEYIYVIMSNLDFETVLKIAESVK